MYQDRAACPAASSTALQGSRDHGRAVSTDFLRVITSNTGPEMTILPTLRFDDDLDPLEIDDEDEDELMDDEDGDDDDDEDELEEEEDWLIDDDEEPPYRGDVDEE